MTWTLSTAVAEFFYCIIGLIFIGTGFKALKDPTCEKRITTAAFWFILAATFIAGPYFPRWITGLCVVLMAILTAFKRVAPSSSDVPAAAKTRAAADRLGYSVFIPPLLLAFSAVLVATFFKSLGANNAIGVSGVIALIAAFLLFRPKPVYAAKGLYSSYRQCRRHRYSPAGSGRSWSRVYRCGSRRCNCRRRKRCDSFRKSVCSYHSLLYCHGGFYHDHGKWFCCLFSNYRRDRYTFPDRTGSRSGDCRRPWTDSWLLRYSDDAHGC